MAEATTVGFSSGLRLRLWGLGFEGKYLQHLSPLLQGAQVAVAEIHRPKAQHLAQDSLSLVRAVLPAPQLWEFEVSGSETLKQPRAQEQKHRDTMKAATAVSNCRVQALARNRTLLHTHTHTHTSGIA